MATRIAVLTFFVFLAPPSLCDTIGQEKLGIVVEGVAKAARAGELELLGKWMSEDFLYSFGGGRSKTEALQRYQKHPDLLEELTQVLASGCTMSSTYSEPHYICPAEADSEEAPYYGYRAAFRLSEAGGWEFVWFVSGD